MNHSEINNFRDYVDLISESDPPKDFLDDVKEKAEGIKNTCDTLASMRDSNSKQYKDGVIFINSLIDGLYKSKRLFYSSGAETNPETSQETPEPAPTNDI